MRAIHAVRAQVRLIFKNRNRNKRYQWSVNFTKLPTKVIYFWSVFFLPFTLLVALLSEKFVKEIRVERDSIFVVILLVPFAKFLVILFLICLRKEGQTHFCRNLEQRTHDSIPQNKISNSRSSLKNNKCVHSILFGCDFVPDN